MNAPFLPRLIGILLVVFLLGLLATAGSYVVEPGTRGIKITLGKAADEFIPEGFGLKAPFITHIRAINVKQVTESLRADCFSSDLQQVIVDLRVLYRIPESKVVQIAKEYAGNPFDSQIAPRVQEALKEVTALYTAEMIVKKREEIKQKALATARLKIGDILVVEDLVIRNIELSPDLEAAIEAKMVADQETAKARFMQATESIVAETGVIRARGEAEAIRIRGEALKLNPAFLRLQIVERWNGRSPLVVPADDGKGGAGLLLPLHNEAGPPGP